MDTRTGADGIGLGSDTSRRGFLTRTLGVAAGAAALTARASLPPSAAGDAGVQCVQANWRFYEKCYGLFFAP